MSYKESDIKVLDEVTHIRTNPGMYIGDTSTPVHLIEEALDNSLDECLGGHASVIAININTKEHIYTVLDNGRGMPFGNDVPVTVSSKLFSGAKFKTMKTAYEICSGLHGVGLVAVNALSDSYLIEIYRDNKHATYKFENSKIKRRKVEKFEGKNPFSTKIQFKPSKKIFKNLLPDIDRIRKRLIIASVELPKCGFMLNVDGKKEIIQLSVNDYFGQYCTKDNGSLTPIITLISNNGPETVNIRFCYSLQGVISPKVLSSVNLLHVDGGGTHVNYFFDILKALFTSKAKKLGVKFQPQDCLCGLRAYLSLSLKEPEFAAQTKDRLINQKTYLDKLYLQVAKQLDEHFTNHQDQLEILLEHFEQYRKKIDSKRIKGATGMKRTSTKFTKLRDCTSNQGVLFVVEGDSAEGSFIQCRDPRTHAVFPLRGKIPSIVNAKDILKNKEIGELIQSLGTGVGPHFNIDNLKYQKIICATDADPDGEHIFCLLTIALANLVPEVIKQGHYFLAQTPLYAINEGKTFTPLWTDKELEKARGNGHKITRFKGLGELSPWQLKICAIEPETRKWFQVNFSENLDEIMKLFSDVQAKRELLCNGKEESKM